MLKQIIDEDVLPLEGTDTIPEQTLHAMTRVVREGSFKNNTGDGYSLNLGG